jgi:hypothetical protein
LPLEKFYLGYQRKDLKPAEFVVSVRIPPRQAGLLVASYKVSKRFDQDISAVCAAFAIQLQQRARGRCQDSLWGHGGRSESSGGERGASDQRGVERVHSGSHYGRAGGGFPSTERSAGEQQLSTSVRSKSVTQIFHRDRLPSGCLANGSRTPGGELTVMVAQAYEIEPLIGDAPRHDSAHLHVSGLALYADDIPLPVNALHAAFGRQQHCARPYKGR